MKDVADKFVRVRLTRIDNTDLNLFEFDYDVTMMVFFLDADANVYARYGGRDARDADKRQSLSGLRAAMTSVLAMHAREEKEFAPKSGTEPRYVRDLAGGMRGRGCMHCHQVKEALIRDLQRNGKWDPSQVWRYPLPENLGFSLDVDRSNVVKKVAEKSPAAAGGLKPGDIVQRLNGMPIHSFADAQFALDHAPAEGTIGVSWLRGRQVMDGTLTLPEDWRRTELGWRPSMHRLLASARVYGVDLTADEKKDLGLSPRQLAFRQKDAVSRQATAAGVRAGDIILGINGKTLEMDVNAFLRYVESNHLIGDRVTLNLIRDGKRLELPMTFVR